METGKILLFFAFMSLVSCSLKYLPEHKEISQGVVIKDTVEYHNISKILNSIDPITRDKKVKITRIDIVATSEKYSQKVRIPKRYSYVYGSEFSKRVILRATTVENKKLKVLFEQSLGYDTPFKNLGKLPRPLFFDFKSKEEYPVGVVVYFRKRQNDR